jgi:hypothetical protein
VSSSGGDPVEGRGALGPAELGRIAPPQADTGRWGIGSGAVPKFATSCCVAAYTVWRTCRARMPMPRCAHARAGLSLTLFGSTGCCSCPLRATGRLGRVGPAGVPVIRSLQIFKLLHVPRHVVRAVRGFPVLKGFEAQSCCFRNTILGIGHGSRQAGRIGGLVNNLSVKKWRFQWFGARFTGRI